MLEAGFQPRALRVENVARRTDEVWLFTFVADEGSTIEGLDFEPGQVAVLAIPELGEAFLAIASPPDASGVLEFLVRRRGALGERLCDLGHLAQVQLKALVGTGFPVDRHEGRDLLFVAAGTAIAPVRAAISHVVARRDRFGRVGLVHGVRRPQDFAVDDELDHWRSADVDVWLTVSQPGEAAWSGDVGRVQCALDRAVHDAKNTTAFVCGSSEMMNETTDLLVTLGITRDRIFRNY